MKKNYALFALLGLVAAITVLIVVKISFRGLSRLTDNASYLRVKVDRQGPYLILVSVNAKEEFSETVAIARQLHPEAQVSTFEPGRPESAGKIMRDLRPRYVMVILRPDELDVNLAWNWIKITASLDGDPFLDTSTGFITAESPAKAAAFAGRILDAVEGRLRLPGKLIDNLGPNQMSLKTAWQKTPGAFMVPVFQESFAVETISHGIRGFTEERLGEMDGAGFIHYGGHGYPDRVIDSLNGVFVRKLRMAPAVFFNGACYTGVTGRWFSAADRVKEHQVDPRVSFALGVLANNTVAYLAPLHPDHGLPVYQEMEYLTYSGASLGDVMRDTHNAVILAAGAASFEPPVLQDGMKAPNWGPAEIMLFGTASRVLFGDPALMPLEAFSAPPFIQTITEREGKLLVDAVTADTKLKSTFANTFASDLSATGQFNARARLIIELPPEWNQVGALEQVVVQLKNAVIPHRMVAWKVEKNRGAYFLHVHIDVKATGFLESLLQRPGARVSFLVSPYEEGSKNSS